MTADEIEKTLKNLKHRFANANPYPWHDHPAKATQEALPFFSTVLRDHLEDFRKVTTPPKLIAVPKTPEELKAGTDNESHGYRDKVARVNYPQCESQVAQIVAFFEGLLKVKDKLVVGGSTPVPVAPAPLPPTPKTNSLPQLKQLRAELDKCNYSGTTYVWATKAATFVSKRFPEYEDEVRRLSGHSDEGYAKSHLASIFDGLIAIEESEHQQSNLSKPGTFPMPAITPSGRKLFISHASADSSLVTHLVDLLQLSSSLTAKDIFYTSHVSTGPENGDNFIEAIKANIADCKAVLFVLSPAYFNSQFCLVELGASWVLAGSRPFLLMIPPTVYGDLKGVLSNLQTGAINDGEKLTQFFENLMTATGATPTGGMVNWEARKRTFLKEAEDYIAMRRKEEDVKPKLRTTEEFTTLQGNYNDASKQLTTAYEDITRLKEQIKALEALKDKAAVANVGTSFATGDEMKQYNDLITTARATVTRLPTVTKEVMYKLFAELPAKATDFDQKALTKELEEKYLLNDGGTLRPNPDDNTVHDADMALRFLEKFLSRAKRETLATIKNELTFSPSLGNKRYWEVFEHSWLFKRANK